MSFCKIRLYFLQQNGIFHPQSTIDHSDLKMLFNQNFINVVPSIKYTNDDPQDKDLKICFFSSGSFLAFFEDLKIVSSSDKNSSLGGVKTTCFKLFFFFFFLKYKCFVPHVVFKFFHHKIGYDVFPSKYID